ncbi:tetratricopeptide repeat protein [Streptomyces sp. NPDC006372]|uniref:tetratricopeptide repeat protein n=1 Tax=Streptomyces sp. NPDC006372 TaxID=3155599 RepID=UPI0033B61A3F
MSNGGNRFSLVIASQCTALGVHRTLGPLDEAATGLDAVLRDPLRGGCRPALADGRTLLLNQDHTTTYAAVAEAVACAGQAGGTLLLVWIGHGMAANGDFYALPEGCTPSPGHPEGPYALVRHLKELLAAHPDPELVLLLDACMSGAGLAEAAAGWTGLNADLRRRIQILSAANLDEPAYDCGFSRSTEGLLRYGHIAWGERFVADDLKRAAERFERRQQPALLSLNGIKAGVAPWVSRNAALVPQTGSLPAMCRADLPALREALRHFRPTASLSELVKASRSHKYVVVSGPAGYGKTTLLAALTRPEVATGVVPQGFVHGLRLFRRQETSDRVARDLAWQLGITVPGFTEAVADHEASVPSAEWEELPLAERLLLGPLGRLPGVLVRIALDGYDQLAESAAAEITDLVERLRSRSGDGADVRLVLSARPGAVPTSDVTLRLEAAPDAEVRRSLEDQEVPEHLLDPIVEAADGSWLVASLLADQVRAHPFMAAHEVPQGLGAVYDLVLDEALEGGRAWDAPGALVRALFTVLAAAGPGAVLPRELLLAACAEIGATDIDESHLDDGLPSPLRRFVVRAPVGGDTSDTWLYGLFHSSLIEHLTNGTESAYSLDVVAGHGALAAVLARLAPAAEYTPAVSHEPLQDYARRAEPEHLWRSGAHMEALERLAARPSQVPADNVRQWQHWHRVIEETYGSDHPLTSIAHHNVAAHTGIAGDLQQAVEMYAAHQGAADGSTLSLLTRANLAAATGVAGDAAGALKQCTALLPDIERVLGPDHVLTLTVRSNIGLWSGEAGNPARALELSLELLPDRVRVLGPDHHSTLTTRHNIALWTAEAGDNRRALALFEELLPDRVRVLGPDHLDTLAVRNNIALLTGESDVERAYELFTELMKDRERVLGPEHPDTLITRSNLSHCIAYLGDPQRALELSEDILAARLRVLGPDHPNTLKARYDIAIMTGQAGRPREELRLLTDLLREEERALGPDHPAALSTRAAIAETTGRLGNAQQSVKLWAAVIEARRRVLGPEHPATLQARACHALETAGAGSPRRALRLLDELLPDHIRVLGPDHRDTLSLRVGIAGLTARRDRDRGCALFSDVLADQVRVLGLTHPDTSTTARHMKALTESPRTGGRRR